jgi:hypothetical protein
MGQPCDMILLEWFGRRVIARSPSKFQLNPFLSKQQKVHPARPLAFLHHPYLLGIILV